MNFTARPTTTASETTYDQFRPFRTHQAGLVARNRCCDLNQAGLSANALKQPFVDKVRKIDEAKSFTAQRLRHCQLKLIKRAWRVESHIKLTMS